MPHETLPTTPPFTSLKLLVTTLIALFPLTIPLVAADTRRAFKGVVISGPQRVTRALRQAPLPKESFQVTGYGTDQLGGGVVLLTKSDEAPQIAALRTSDSEQPQPVTRKECWTAKIRKTLKKLEQRTKGAKWRCSPNYAFYQTTTPNDPFYYLQYASGLMSLPDAWDITTGANDIVALVIDSGIDYSHPDLAASMWVNTGEVAGNGIDDDSNGYIDDVYGVNTITNTGDPRDDNGHGTHVAGIIGAKGNNLTGIAGVSWNVKLAGAKFLSSSGSGSLSNALKAINYGNDLKRAGHNVVVSNNSWGGGGFSLALSNAIKDSESLGILFVAAAGNATNNNDISPFYPAGYTNNNVISVASVTSTGALSSFSNYGATTVDIAAPGSSIPSTYLTNQYAYLSGTSMAAPQVSGVISLAQSACGGTLSVAQMRAALLTTGTQYAGLAGKVASGAIVNAAEAVRAGQTGCALSTPTPDPLPTTEPTATLTATATASPVPSTAPTSEPTAQPTAQPTSQPIPDPSPTPGEPTAAPTTPPTTSPVPTEPPATPAPTSTPPPLPSSTPTPPATQTPTSTPTPLPLVMSVAPNVNVRTGSRFTVAIGNVPNVQLQPVLLSLLDPNGRRYRCGSLGFPAQDSLASATFTLPVTARYFTALTFTAETEASTAQANLTVWRPLRVTNRALQRGLASTTCQIMMRSARRIAARANRRP